MKNIGKQKSRKSYKRARKRQMMKRKNYHQSHYWKPTADRLTKGRTTEPIVRQTSHENRGKGNKCSGSTSDATTSSSLIVMMSFDDFSPSKTAIFVIRKITREDGRTVGRTDGRTDTISYKDA